MFDGFGLGTEHKGEDQDDVHRTETPSGCGCRNAIYFAKLRDGKKFLENRLSYGAGRLLSRTAS
jgi:hypothetical protein